MKLVKLAIIAALSTATAAPILEAPALAQSSGKELTQITFASTDQNGDGALSVSEMSEMAQNITVSMDADEDMSVSLSEFMEWDFGFHYLAEQEDGDEGYAAVKRIMFALHDLNSDGAIDPTETRITTFWSFSRADLDNDRLLSEDEYFSAWMPVLLMKAGRGG
ncbi:MAG: hypothetical protein AAGC96_06275 [Pseudomonadota bacterium]